MTAALGTSPGSGEVAAAAVTLIRRGPPNGTLPGEPGRSLVASSEGEP